MPAPTEEKEVGGPDHIVERITHFTRSYITVVEKIFRLKTKLYISQGPGIFRYRKVRIDNPALYESGITQCDEVIGLLKPRRIRKL